MKLNRPRQMDSKVLKGEVFLWELPEQNEKVDKNKSTIKKQKKGIFSKLFLG